MTDLLLLGRIAGERVAFRAADVRAVVEIDKITPTPLAPSHVAGLAPLRSRPLTVIDTLRALELGADAGAVAAGRKQAVVVDIDRHLYALLVDAIEDVVGAQSELAVPPGKLLAGWERCAIGLVESAAGPLLVVDPAAIVAGPQNSEAA